jgi:hypothetical protein
MENLRHSGATRIMLGGLCFLVASLGTAAWRAVNQPVVWHPNDVPVAFWSWRADAPSQEDVERAVKATGAKEIFLRAGQFDLKDGTVRRIRSIEGAFPRGVRLHLVYNATRELLLDFEQIEPAIMAAAVAHAFANDVESAARSGAMVDGLQLDFDSPTRLLARYADVLRATREQLPPQIRLSITGLPTWMDSIELTKLLAVVDFWAPQFYGGEIPQRIDRLVPISSPRAVARDVARARKLGKPFYAGLAAYGYALLYSMKGDLIAMRGDLDPTSVAANHDFEQVDLTTFERRPGSSATYADGPRATEWRYVFCALRDTNLQGLSVRSGERIAFDLPSSESLRTSVRGVREEAGNKLLGILLFRLPGREDPTTLNVEQISAALADKEAEARIEVQASSSRDQLTIRATNAGATGAMFSEDAFSITMPVRSGSIRGVASLDGFDSFETLCGDASNEQSLRPCSAARANVVRLKASSFICGANVSARLSVVGENAPDFNVAAVMRVDDGRLLKRQLRLLPQEESR